MSQNGLKYALKAPFTGLHISMARVEIVTNNFSEMGQSHTQQNAHMTTQQTNQYWSIKQTSLSMSTRHMMTWLTYMLMDASQVCPFSNPFLLFIFCISVTCDWSFVPSRAHDSATAFTGIYTNTSLITMGYSETCNNGYQYDDGTSIVC